MLSQAPSRVRCGVQPPAALWPRTLRSSSCQALSWYSCWAEAQPAAQGMVDMGSLCFLFSPSRDPYAKQVIICGSRGWAHHGPSEGSAGSCPSAPLHTLQTLLRAQTTMGTHNSRGQQQLAEVAHQPLGQPGAGGTRRMRRPCGSGRKPAVAPRAVEAREGPHTHFSWRQPASLSLKPGMHSRPPD